MHRSPSSTPTAALREHQPTFGRTVPDRRPSKSTVIKACRQIGCRRSSRIRSPTSTQREPLRLGSSARIGRIPDTTHGYAVALALFAFVAFFAMGPGVCVWLALSELMPTRIRSIGMSVALVLNQLVSTVLAVIFLPVVSKHGYSFMFLIFAASTAVYLFIAAFLLPETKGKTLEEVELYFEGYAQS